MRRIFVAVSLSRELQNGIFEWRKYHKNLPVRWLEGENLHISLVPPWYEDDIEKVGDLLTQISGKIKPFDISFKRVNFGPDPKKPRLIWAENMPTREMIDLRDELEKIFNQRSNYRKWTMHTTIARFRPETFSSFPIKKLDEEVWWPETVESVALYESNLKPEGAEYKILKEVIL